MSANDKKIKHYASEYQHWDLAVVIPLGYFEGCSTKYVCRWRKKGGLDDLHKAMHYLDKLIESFQHKPIARNLNRSEIQYEVSRFSAANRLSIIEEEFILLLCNYKHEDDLRTARLVLEDIIDLAHEPDFHSEVAEETGLDRKQAKELNLAKAYNVEPNRPGTPDDGGHHATGQTDPEELA